MTNVTPFRPKPAPHHQRHGDTKKTGHVEISHLGRLKSDDPAQNGKPYFILDLIENGERLNLWQGVGINAALEIAVEQICSTDCCATKITFKSEVFGDD